METETQKLPLKTAISSPHRSHHRSPQRKDQEEDRAGLDEQEKIAYQRRIEKLFDVERQFRKASSVKELGMISVNETRFLLKFSQAVLLHANTKNTFCVTAASSLTNIDPTAPFIHTIEQDIAYLRAHHDLSKPLHIRQTSLRPKLARIPEDQMAGECLLWVPLLNREGEVFAGHIYARKLPWTQKEDAIASHLAEVAAHAWVSHSGSTKSKRKALPKNAVLLGLLACIAALFIPVPMTVLAPAEIVAQTPDRIAAPIDGVIEKILVEPNTYVEQGTTLFRYVDTDLRSDFELAARQLNIAQARLQRFSQAAFDSQDAKSELAIAAAEVELAKSQKAFAAERLAKIIVKAQNSGLVIYEDKDAWTAKPVATGQQVMDIANPSKVKGRLELSVSDSIALKEGAKVRIFMDADPLNPISATLDYASYHAEPTPTGTLAYTVDVLLQNEQTPPRIGLQGIAQLYGEKVSLGFFLFRRPLSAIRQYFGI